MAPGKWILPRKISINRHRDAILCLIVLPLLICSAPQSGAFFEASNQTPDLAAWQSYDLEEGDILLRRGSSFISTLISRATPSAKGMSHCGIVIWEKGKWQIIHSISGSISDQDGIRMESVQSFVSKADKDMIWHIKPAFGIDRQKLGINARHYLAQKTPFDHDFDLSDSNRLYCTEFVRSVYLDSGAEDVFTYRNVAGKLLVDLSSFFEEAYWKF